MRLLVAAAIIVVLLAWNVGEQHKSNCIDQGYVGCGVLPWNNGHKAQGTVPSAARRALIREALQNQP